MSVSWLRSVSRLCRRIAAAKKAARSRALQARARADIRKSETEGAQSAATDTAPKPADYFPRFHKDRFA